MKKQIIILILLIIAFLNNMVVSASSVGAVETSISSCRTLNQADYVYVLNTRVSSGGTCFTIGANNITLDGKGYSVNYSSTGAGYGIVNTAGYNNIKIQNLNLLQNNRSITNSHGIYFKNVVNSQITNITITTQGTSSDGIYLNSSNLNNFININIVTINNSAHGIYLNGNYNIFSNINLIVGNASGIYLRSAGSNNIHDGSIISRSSNDYYLQNAGRTNSFRNTNFTKRKIYLYDNISSFNYINENGIRLSTTQVSSTALAITRTLINWTNTNVSWQETLSGDKRLNYSISGLLTNTNYHIWNGPAIAYSLTTDGNGNLPEFGVNLNKTLTIIRVITSQNIIVPNKGIWVNLNGSTGSELIVSDNPSLNNLSAATWNIWVNQNIYTPNAGLFGKYQASTGKRSYDIRTSDTNEISIVLSANGINTSSFNSSAIKDCGIRNNSEWTMITVTYDGSQNKSQITYYRNGVKCDTDSTTIKSLYNASVPLRIGGGNNIFFNGSIDEPLIYKYRLPDHQVYRFYQESEHGLAGKQTIPVLIYHRVTDPADYFDKVNINNFTMQINYLHNNGFTTITAENFKQWQKGNFTMPKKPVIIFFDDGWNYTYNNVLPVFSQYGYIGVIPVVTNYASYTNDTSYMRWWQLNDLQNKGWEIASHSVDHVYMTGLNESKFREELNLSKISIERNLGIKPTSFIFPSHQSNVTYTAICGEYYDLCWTYGSSDISPKYSDYSDDGHVYQSLKRITIYNSTTIEIFKNMFIRDNYIPAATWPLNEGIGNIAYDSSGNGNNALLGANATWYIQN